MITTYTVTGMTCEHCVKHITAEVSQLDGVNEVEISLTEGTMSITSDGPLDFDTVAAAVDDAGDYTVAPA